MPPGGLKGEFSLLSFHEDVDFTTASPKDIIPKESCIGFGQDFVWIYLCLLNCNKNDKH